MPAPSAAMATLAERHRDAYNRLRSAVGDAVEAQWAASAGVSDAGMAVWLDSITPTLQTANQMAAGLTRVSVATALDVAGEPGHGAVMALQVTGTPRGVPLADVFARPIVVVRTKLSEGQSWVEAMRAGMNLARNLAETDVSLVQRQTMAQASTVAVDAGAHVVGYRRTLTGRSCVFCAVASTARYHVGELMPLHGRCDCGVAPIIGTRDPGRVINKAILADLKSADGAGPQYWASKGWVDAAGKVIDPASEGAARLAAVVDHGELGPAFGATVSAFRP
jgi:hypothetical protein